MGQPSRRAIAPWLALLALPAMAGGCGAGPKERVPDESQDMAVGSRGSGVPTLEGTRPVGPEVDATTWKWVEATCTEGRLELGEQGFMRQARVSADPQGLLIVYDHAFPQQACVQTVVQRAVPGSTRDAPWTMTEEAHVSLPPGCGIAPEEDRPGHVRMREGNLEVFVQRSNWCNGLEVRMAYEPAPPAPLAGDQLVRHYAAHFNRRDALRLTALFASNGSVVEPFTPSQTGSTRHEGASSIHAWYAQLFAGVPWLALRLTSLERGEQQGQWLAAWEYMDPRVKEPFSGRNYFTVGGGEIFETRIELAEEPKEGEPPPLETAGPEPGSDGEASAEPSEGPEGEAEAGEGDGSSEDEGEQQPAGETPSGEASEGEGSGGSES